MLKDIDQRFGLAAVTELCGSGDWPPTISQVRRMAYNLSRGTVAPPSPWEAWERAVNGDTAGDIEKRALELVGGSYAVRRGESPEIIRAQFLKCYSELLEKHDREICAIPEAKQLAFENRPEITPLERQVEAPEEYTPVSADDIMDAIKNLESHVRI